MMPVLDKQIWVRVSPEAHSRLKSVAHKYHMTTSGYLRVVVDKLLGLYREPMLPNEPSHDDPARRRS